MRTVTTVTQPLPANFRPVLSGVFAARPSSALHRAPRQKTGLPNGRPEA